ncbi:MAG TPA: rod shape-determining protein MreC [Erysipelotrichaceae bacterium]|nr:rod shape-determining protein MreC [Erysipelotrichaceae bacterium]
MKQMTPIQKALAIIASILLVLTISLNVIQMTAPKLGQDQKSYNFFAQLQYALISRPATAVTSFIYDLSSLWKVMDENKILRSQVELIAIYQAKLEEAYRDIDELKKFNELLLSMSESDTISATVIQRSLESFTHTIVLNIGTNDGVELGDAVISSKGLIGKVSSVSENTCVVLLLTTELDINKITVKIQVDEVKTSEAILENYDPNTQSYTLKLLDTNSSITEGMKVISSGSGGLFPSGLLVGTVNLVENLPNAIGLKILVSPAADFYHLNYVAVVKRGVINE